ncbi:MAG: hypothetical protein IH988_02720 [Planctomycetes bacterium]|nr:hypothetical protein [Planctomycetota bacterium]
MVRGVHLTLMIGPGVPLPVSKDVIDALQSVEVTTSTEGPSVFQLSFKLSTRSPLHTIFLLSGGSTPIPLVRVVIIATVRGSPEVLIDGILTNHEVSPGDTPGEALLTMTGEDLTKVMDWIPLDGLPYPAMPPAARVLLALAKYAVLGVVPMVIPSVLIDVPIPVERIPRHKGTDLSYIKALADEVGYVFYIDPGPQPGMSVAYWGPEFKVGAPQPALNLDMDAHTNVESLSFNFDSEERKLPVVFIHEPISKAPILIPVPDITPLNPPLGAVPPIPKGIEPIRGTGKYSPVRAALIGLAKAAKSSDALRGTGSLDVMRYGRVLKARRLVGVRGAGLAFDGLYYVASVTHSIRRGEYKQNFTLVRNGLLSTVQRVPA